MTAPWRGRHGLACTLVAVLALGACAEQDADEAEPDPAPAEETPEGQPSVDVPDGGAPPAALEVEDLEEGDGDEVADGALVTAHYVGVRWSDGVEFASSWDRGQPLTYEHGEGRWVAGWQQGVEGMREGGRRRIVVPPDLAYGERGAPGVPAGETLVFVIDVLDVA